MGRWWVLPSMETITTSRDTEIARTLISDFDRGFTEMVHLYQPGIYSGARRLTRRAEDASDVAQDTFVKAYTALGGYDEERIRAMRFQPWLWTIALNLCRNRARDHKVELPLRDAEIAEATPHGVVDDAAWERRLATLNQNQRNAVVLRHVLDLPIADIAEATGRPEGTVKADIARGLDRLRSTMQAEELNEH
jgi:RNA polymerase sigma-70 factor, ECF subfamily